MNIKKYTYSLLALATLATLVGAVSVSAQTTGAAGNPTNNVSWNGQMHSRAGGMNRAPGVFGTVSAMNGNILTVTSKKFPNKTATATTTTYTVDATNAKIMKNNVAGTISSIVIGDAIVAQGTLTGTNLVATNIRDGVMTRGGPGKMPGKNATDPLPPTITGNGQPVIAGSITAINGSTLTVTNKSNVTYTVDVTTAKIMQGSNTVTISNLTVGDSVIAQGIVNGNTVVASTLIDQKVQPASTTGATTVQPKGFFGRVGSFFAHLFGY